MNNDVKVIRSTAELAGELKLALVSSVNSDFAWAYGNDHQLFTTGSSAMNAKALEDSIRAHPLNEWRLLRLNDGVGAVAILQWVTVKEYRLLQLAGLIS